MMNLWRLVLTESGAIFFEETTDHFSGNISKADNLWRLNTDQTLTYYRITMIERI